MESHKTDSVVVTSYRKTGGDVFPITTPDKGNNCRKPDIPSHDAEFERPMADTSSRNPLINNARSLCNLFHNTKVLVHILVCIFAVASWVDINGMWAELPLLVEKAPEGWTLPSYIIVISQVANIGPLIFVVVSCLAPQTKPKLEKVTSFVIIIVGMVASFLLAFLWEYTTEIGGAVHSTSLLTLNFFLALGDCTSSVSFYAFMSYLKPEYIATLFIGEGLSGLIPAVIAIGQGAGSIVCNGTVPISTDPNFSVRVYFIILSGILLVSAIAFLLLNFWDYCKSEMVAPTAANTEITIHQPKPSMASYGTLDNPTSPISEHSQDKSYVGPYSASISDQTADCSRQNPAGTSVTDISNSSEDLVTHYASSKSSRLFRSVRSLVQVPDISVWKFFLLMALIILINMTITTFLSSIQIYSVLPYGLQYYHLTTTLPQIANPVACLVALLVMVEHTVVIVVITCLGQVCVGYLIYVAAMSPTPPLHGEDGGGILAVAMWVLVSLLLTYAKVCIAGVLRKHGRNALIWGGACTQTGSLIGAIVGFLLVNEYNLFKDAPYCT